MILQKVITTSKATILVIGGLKEPVYSLGIDNCILWFNGCGVGNAPAGEWERLGFLKDISEDVAKGIIPYINELVGYMDYARNNNISFDTATESLHSLIQINCKLKNKYGEKMPELESTCCDKCVADRNGFPECCGIPIPSEQSIYLWLLWQGEQSKIFTNPFLLKRI